MSSSSAAKAKEKTLITFDVDGTLIRSVGENANRFHKNAFSHGFKKIAKIKTSIDVLKTKHHGSTDKLIIKRVLEFHEIDHDDEIVENVAKAMCEYAEENAHEAASGVELLGGVKELLHVLHEREDTLVTLVTGNLEPIAWSKMKGLGILQYFDILVRGGFGSDHVERSELVRIVHERAQSEGFLIKERRFHFGDTPNDITAAETSGSIPVGLATGIFSLDDLRSVSNSPESAIFVDSLDDTRAVLELLGI